MILWKTRSTLICLIILKLAISESQNARSYDTSDWIPISEPCRNCKNNEHVVEKKATGRVLNLPENSRKNILNSNEYRNTRQANNYQQYLRQPDAPSKQNDAQNQQQTIQFNLAQQQLSPAQLQQLYTNQHLLPNIDLITQQVLQQSRSQPRQQQAHPALTQTQNTNQYQIVPQQVYNSALLQQNLLKQNYPTIPQQFLLPQQLPQEHQQLQLYDEQGHYLQQPQLQKLPSVNTAPLVNPQTITNLQQSVKPQIQQSPKVNLTANFYDNSGIQNVNSELLNTADQSFKTIDITSTTPKNEKENVQLLYVPLEHLQSRHQASNPTMHSNQQSQKVYRQKQPPQQLRKETLLESIEKDFIEQALQAHKLQQQFEDQSFYPQPTTQTSTSTLRSVSRKRKPHQPPLAVYMNGPGSPKVIDVLNALKEAKTIDVQDTIGPESPHVFVGPANLDPPEGFSKFDLPYLSNIESNRIERKVDQLPFFVAPLNYKTPTGYSKIPFPSPHVGSVIVNNNEIEKSIPLETVPSIEDFLNPYQSGEPSINNKQNIETPHVTNTQEQTSVYRTRKPSRTRGRQQHKSRTHSNIVQEKQAADTYNGHIFPTVSSTISPTHQESLRSENLANVEINNPSINLNNQLNSQSINQFSLLGSTIQQQQGFPNIVNDHKSHTYYVEPNLQTTTTQSNIPINKSKPSEQSDLNYFPEHSNLKATSLVQNNNNQRTPTPKYITDFEIVPSISSTISPYSEKGENFFHRFKNPQDDSATSTTHSYEDYSSKSRNQNNRYLANEGAKDVFSIIPTIPTNEKVTKDDRRYLPLDSQSYTPVRQLDYDDILQLPLDVRQINFGQGQSNIQTVGSHESTERSLQPSYGNSDIEKYTILEEYPVSSINTTPKEDEKTKSRNEYIPNEQLIRHQYNGDFEQTSVKSSPSRQRTRGRASNAQFQKSVQNEYVPVHQPEVTQFARGINTHPVQQKGYENYDSLPVNHEETKQSLTDKSNGIQEPLKPNTYENNYQEIPSSPIINPVLPGLINSLEDPSIRQLLTPILLAPTEKILTSEAPVTQSIKISTANNQYNDNIPVNFNIEYEQYTTTTNPAQFSKESIIEIETTTLKRQRNRGRGNSRFNDRTTTSSPRRNPQRARTQHPSRTRYRQEKTTEVYSPIRQAMYSTTTDIPRRTQSRQRFRTRVRPVQTENYSATPSTKANIHQLPETTTILTEATEQETEHNTEINHSYYEEQSTRKPQLITRSKILTPEEEYLVNKYNLAVTTVEDTPGENLNAPFLNHNIRDELPEQRLESSKTVKIQQLYSTATPVLKETEITTTHIPIQRTHSQKQNVERNLIRKEQNPIRIRTRIRSRKTTPTPTTTTTTGTILSSASSIEEKEEDFYGFFRQPVFSKPSTIVTTQKTENENSLFEPIIISNPTKSILYEDEEVENNDGIQIFANNQPSPSTPIHFIGEILPKHTTTSEKYYEATHESLPPADKYVSISTSPTTEVTKRRGRLPLRKYNSKQDETGVNEVQSIREVTTRKPIQRTRGRGRAQYKLPSSVTTEQSPATENYPQLYLKAKEDRQEYTPQTPKSIEKQTDKPAFQITIDPAYEVEDNEDQEPYSSILRPKVLYPSSNSNHWQTEEKLSRNLKSTESNTNVYETTTITEDNVTSTTEIGKENAIPTNKPKRRGYWKLVKLRKVTDDFEASESQNIGVISLNSYNDEKSEKNSKSSDAAEKGTSQDLVDSFYAMFQITTAKPENKTDTNLPQTSVTTTTELSEITISSETPTTATPFMPEELETTTMNDNNISSNVTENSSNSNTVPITEQSALDSNSNWNLEVMETSTSTSTEISHKTEICYKGFCVRSNEMK